MDDSNILDMHTRQPIVALADTPPDRLKELIELEHEVFELRHTISVLAVELVGYRERYG